MQNDYYAAMERQLKAFIASGFGQLALQIKNDFIRDREMIEQLRERISELEDRFKDGQRMVTKQGEGLTSLKILPRKKIPPDVRSLSRDRTQRCVSIGWARAGH